MAFGRTYNSSNVDTSRGHMVIPAGDYDVQIVTVTDEVSRSSGRDQIKLELKIISGPCSGGKLFYYITDDQYADQRIWEVLTSCRREIPAQISSNTFRGGLTGRVRVKVEQYNGESRPQVNYWMRPKAGSQPATAPAAAAPAGTTNPNNVPF